jgi:hypothetical protein
VSWSPDGNESPLCLAGRDLLDFIDMMLATGERYAITWEALDLDAGTVEIRGTVVTQDFYMGRKIDSEDAARVLEVFGRPDAAARIRSPENESCCEPGGFLGWILTTKLVKPLDLRFWLPELDLNQQPCD